MIIEQVVQVEFLGQDRAYTYVYKWGEGDKRLPLIVGDVVEVPANSYRETSATALVVELGSKYKGKMAEIVRRLDE